MGTLELTARRIDLWHIFTDEAAAPAREACRDLLSAEEARRAERYTHPEARRQFVLGRALLRTALARYTGDDPKSLEFDYNPRGKPSLRSPPDMPLEFSLSHTRGLAVCAVALGHAVGVDAESRQRHRTLSPLELARRYFAPAETAALAGLPAEAQFAAFLDFWTLKEAFVKARGTGLAVPLADFAFSLFPDRPPTIAFSGPGPDRPEAWQFAQPRLAAGYHVAVAVHRPAANPATIVWRGDGGGERGERKGRSGHSEHSEESGV
jgi:4'-phosphopantetheinyl transferase